MSNSKFSDDLKHDAVHQIIKRGNSATDVSRRLDVSTHSLYAWVKRYSKITTNPSGENQSAGVRRMKLELARVIEERDILKKVTAYFAKDAKQGTRLWQSIVPCFRFEQCAGVCISASVIFMHVLTGHSAIGQLKTSTRQN